MFRNYFFCKFEADNDKSAWRVYDIGFFGCLMLNIEHTVSELEEKGFWNVKLIECYKIA